ncbi:MFS general substrate transporter [Glarea lozoyensis ATCC 20868]|uniref:MFS general substrate transporter n=2 Tax=Glarea lozoyensis TaxID=101852 RepID=S3CGC9_GLAL2|nr:MFS general substrate transporter [Glarea lozoyensis ATCC 20868]EPE25582.1 MFS general substrate transporter [Glarea lozoyensis ATCC 20868]
MNESREKLEEVILDASSDSPDETITTMEYPTKLKLVMTVVALVLSMFLAALDMTILSTAIPEITSDFNSLEDIGWYASAFFLTIASFQSTWGKAYKYFDLKPVFLLGIAIFELGSLICGVSPNSAVLIVGRAITGLGAAGILGGCFTIIAFSVPPLKRPAFNGILGATYGFASVVGPLLGGFFTAKVSWRWCFYINLPIGGVSAAIILFFFKTPKGANVANDTTLREKILQMDLPGAALIMAAVVCYILALQDAGVAKAWNSPTVIGLLVGFGLIVIAFGLVEYLQKDRALFLPRLMKDRTMIVCCAFTGVFGGSFFVLLYYLPIYFQSVQGVSASDSGIRNLPFIIAMTLFIVLSGGALTTFGYFTPFFIAGAVLTTIGSGLLYTLDIGSPSSHWIGFQILAGIGLGISFQAPIMVGQALAEDEDVATVTAILMFIQTIGGALLVSAANAAFVNTLISELRKNVPSIDPLRVILAGATGLRDAFTEEQLPGLLVSYMAALKVTYAIAIATSGGAVLIAFFSPWRSIKGKVSMGVA